MSSTELRELSEWIRAEQLDVRAMVLLKNGKLVLEWYARGVSREHNHNIFSVTKTVVATLVGAAIQSGELSGVDSAIADVFPESDQLDQRLSAMTLEQLLTMRSGFPVSRGNQPSGPSRALFDDMHGAPNRVKRVLQLDLERSPGARFAYNNVDPQLALAMLSRATGQSAWELLSSKLIDPLEMRNVKWRFADDAGLPPGGYGLRMRAIDLAKVGQLFLRYGRWETQQLISESYARAAASDQTGSGYGYYWWINQGKNLADTFSARGVRGQQIFVDRQRDLVFAIASDIEPMDVKKTIQSINERVVSAVYRQALPADSTASRALENEIRNASRYAPNRRSSIPRGRLPWPPETD